MTLPSAYQTTDDMVTAVLRNTSQPNNQQTFQPADILAFLNEEMSLTLTTIVNDARADYWLFYSDTTIVPNVTQYSIPVRSVMAAVDDIVMVDAQGNEIEIPQLDQAQKKTGTFYQYVPATLQRGIYFRNDTINTWPLTLQLPANYLIRVKYIRRPNTLVATSSCAQVSSVDYNAKTITCTTVPAAWATGGGDTLDIINNLPQFTSVQDGIVTSGISGSVVSFASLPTGIAAGQWLCPTGTTCVPQIPFESYPLLVNLGCLRVYMAQQNANGFQVTSKIVESMAADVAQLLQPRWKGTTKKIVNRNVAFRGNGGPNGMAGMAG